MEEDIEELLKRKDDYDFAYGTQIYRPYTMSEKDWELIENLLTRYKELEEWKKEKGCSIQEVFELFIPKSKVKEILNKEKLPLTIVGGRRNAKTLEYGRKLGRIEVCKELLGKE